MLTNIFRYLKSLAPQPRGNAGREFIEKFVLVVPVTAEEVDRMRSDLVLDYQTAVKATLLVHVYGIHLALQGAAARKVIQQTDKTTFEMEMLSRFLDASLKKLGVNGNAHSLYGEMSRHMEDMDSEFRANANDTNGPFFAVTKCFMRIVRGEDLADIAVMFTIAASIGNHMQSTVEMFDVLYENEYRF